MKQTSTTAFLLAFLAALLVLVAAVVFLARDNRLLEGETADLATNQAMLAAANEQANLELTFREGEVEAANTNLSFAVATRDMLATELASETERAEMLAAEVAQRATLAAEAETAANLPELQFFSHPNSSTATVLPNTDMELFVAVYANNGVANIEVMLNGEPWDTRPGSRGTTAVANFDWVPEREGTYVFEATSIDLNGQMSVPRTITITAAYPSEAARLAALQEEVELGVEGILLPEPSVTPTAVPGLEQTQPESMVADLHQQLLFGSDTYTETAARTDSFVYRAFRFELGDFDLEDYAAGLQEQELLGSYNPEIGSVTVYNSDLGDEPAVIRWLTAHSFTHDLQIERGWLNPAIIPGLEREKRMALRALVEGQANFVQNTYLQDGEAFTPDEQAGVIDVLGQQASAFFNEVPPFLQAQFEFPYRYGFQFFQFLFEQGGPELVDDIWLNPPQSSEQIIHPERYQAGDIPVDVSVPSLTDVLVGDWERVVEDTLGEFFLRQHLGVPDLSDEDVELAATGWGGDRYVIYFNAPMDELVLAWRLAWDEAADAAEFETVYFDYLGAIYESDPIQQGENGQCWQGEDVTCLFRLDSDTFVVRAPDIDTAVLVVDGQT